MKVFEDNNFKGKKHEYKQLVELSCDESCIIINAFDIALANMKKGAKGRKAIEKLFNELEDKLIISVG